MVVGELVELHCRWRVRPSRSFSVACSSRVGKRGQGHSQVYQRSLAMPAYEAANSCRARGSVEPIPSWYRKLAA
jgi:hypothetical protein